jgi:hypothetical protein
VIGDAENPLCPISLPYLPFTIHIHHLSLTILNSPFSILNWLARRARLRAGQPRGARKANFALDLRRVRRFFAHFKNPLYFQRSKLLGRRLPSDRRLPSCNQARSANTFRGRTRSLSLPVLTWRTPAGGGQKRTTNNELRTTNHERNRRRQLFDDSMKRTSGVMGIFPIRCAFPDTAHFSRNGAVFLIMCCLPGKEKKARLQDRRALFPLLFAST